MEDNTELSPENILVEETIEERLSEDFQQLLERLASAVGHSPSPGLKYRRKSKASAYSRARLWLPSAQENRETTQTVRDF